MGHNSYEATILGYMSSLDRMYRTKPLYLGGIAASGGGTGSPPGGVVGYLTQTNVAFDISELAYSGIPASGMSLLDNLNRIRYNISGLMASGSGASDFLSLTDVTPSSYFGYAGRAVIVNELETGLDFSSTLDYSFISSNDSSTDVSGAELEELTDSSETALHSHAPVIVGQYRSMVIIDNEVGGWEFVSSPSGISPVYALSDLE